MLKRKVHIGKLLLDKNLLTQEQLDTAVARQKTTGDKLGEILTELGFVDKKKLYQLLTEQLGIPFVDIKNYSFDSPTVNLLPEFYARRYRAIVLKNENNNLLVGMADPQDIVAYDEIARVLNQSFSQALVDEDDLLISIDMLYRHTSEITSFAEKLSEELKEYDYDIQQLGVGLSSSDAPVVKMLQSIFEDAVQVNASDVHIEPEESAVRIRQRVDGVLQEQIINERSVAAALALRLKLMAGLNIAEKRVPQDGRFTIRVKNLNFDVRLSTIPVQFGESIVMRLLNQSAKLLNLDQIGMPKEVLEQFRRVLMIPHGLILVTGPTGSGKTTTLYGAITELNTPDKKIITVEDPVEYRISRVNQIQVQTKIDLTFANVLRSILRQDPDIILVGELRDEETVGIAMRAALTGHLVLSTLHTNDSISSAARLIDMHGEPYLIATVLRAVIAQRLVRRICSHCSTDVKPTPQEMVWLESISNQNFSTIAFKAGGKCAYCHYTGYKGQIGLYEFLEMNAELAEALRSNQLNEFNQLAVKSPGFQSLAMSGLNLAVQGITTIDEIMRTVGEI